MSIKYPFLPPGYVIEEDRDPDHYGDIDIHKLPKTGVGGNNLIAWVSKRHERHDAPSGTYYAIQRSVHTQERFFVQEVATQQEGLDLLAARICMGILEPGD